VSETENSLLFATLAFYNAKKTNKEIPFLPPN
jgi:hypothetical protein